MSDGDHEHLIEVTGPSARSLDILARTLHVKNAELQPTLQAIAATAVKMLSPALHAGLTIFSRGELTPRASTGEAPLLLDRLQQELGDGPCIKCRQAPVHFPDRGHRPGQALATVQRRSSATERTQHALRAALDR